VSFCPTLLEPRTSVVSVGISARLTTPLYQTLASCALSGASVAMVHADSEIRSPQKVSSETSASDRGECWAAQIRRRRSSSAVSPTACDSSDTFGRRTEAAGEWVRTWASWTPWP
jgi:hypothetical protein